MASWVLEIASIWSNSALSGIRRSCSALPSSIAIVQKSPIFCSSVPGVALLFAAFSLIVRSWTYISSWSTLAIPQEDSVAGIGFFFSHAPFAYSKKSSPGFAAVSMSAARKSCLGGADCGQGLLQLATSAIARKRARILRGCMKQFSRSCALGQRRGVAQQDG